MTRSSQCMVAALFVAAAFIAVRSQTSESELSLGVAAYKDSRYEEAIRHFEKAVSLDSDNIKAHMYLATAYLSEYIPGVDTNDNNQVAERAIQQYENVLNSDSDQTQKSNSAKGIGYLYLNMKKWDEARHYYERASGLDANDPEPYYSVGVIDWTMCYQPRMEARAELGLKPDENLNGKIAKQKKACDELKGKNAPLIEEGMRSLQKAIELRPDYDDAMAYLNLMYREKADLECDDLAARAQDLKTADHWVDMTLAVKKAKAEKEKVLAPRAPNPQ